MKTSKNRAKRISAPHYEKMALRFLTTLEIAVFNHYYQTLSYTETARALNLEPIECSQILKRVLKKLKAFFRLYNKIENEINISLFPRQSRLDQPIEIQGFSTKLFHLLKSAECETLRDVLKLSEYELSRIRGMGPVTLKELKEKLAKKGLAHFWRSL